MTFTTGYTPYNKTDDNLLNGKIFNNIKVIKFKFTRNKLRYFECECLRCQKIFNKEISAILHSQNLGCGICFRKKHLMSNHRIYQIYKHIKQRCYNVNAKAYQRYGAMGIKICQDWLDNVESFIDWAIKNGYQDGLTIDRINNLQGYYPENCRWINMSGQNANRMLQTRNKSGCPGVQFRKKKWYVQIRHNKVRTYLGCYSELNEAINVRNQHIIKNNLPHYICNI